MSSNLPAVWAAIQGWWEALTPSIDPDTTFQRHDLESMGDFDSVGSGGRIFRFEARSGDVTQQMNYTMLRVEHAFTARVRLNFQGMSEGDSETAIVNDATDLLKAVNLRDGQTWPAGLEHLYSAQGYRREDIENGVDLLIDFAARVNES